MKTTGVAYAYVPDKERRKLDRKAVKLHFMGYANNAKGYRLLHEEKKRILISPGMSSSMNQALDGNRNVKFLVQRIKFS